jgi:hypothetical protein
MKQLKSAGSAPIKMDGVGVSDDRFSSIIERRLLSRLKKRLPDHGVPQLIVTDKLSEIAIQRALKRPHDLSLGDHPTGDGAYLLLSWSAEDIIERFLQGISQGMAKQPLPKGHIPLWWDVTEEEMEYYAKLRGMECRRASGREHLEAWMPVLDRHMIFGMARTIDNINYFSD